jgi:hypothetical protein
LLLYFKRFINDVIGVWIGSDDDWKLFQTSLNFGTLKWTFTPLSQTVDFLDLTLTIDPTTRRIQTKTFQKPMNLYLYLIREAKSVLVSDYWVFFTVISILNPDFCTVHRYISN